MHKKVWVGTVAVFVVYAVMDMLVNGMLLESTYRDESMKHLWRPEEEMKMWLFIVVEAFVAFFFTLIFSKGYEGKGIGEGIRYGLYVGLMMSIPMAYGSYGAMPITYSLALQWFLYGVIEFVILGVVAAAVFGKEATVTAVRPA
jgi:hypothetical protein